MFVKRSCVNEPRFITKGNLSTEEQWRSLRTPCSELLDLESPMSMSPEWMFDSHSMTPRIYSSSTDDFTQQLPKPNRRSMEQMRR